MKLIFEAEGVKRELRGPFNICASRADLERLRRQLDGILRDWDESSCCYGWATIYPEPQPGAENTAPVPWMTP